MVKKCLTYFIFRYTVIYRRKHRRTNRFVLITRRSQVRVLPLLKNEANLLIRLIFFVVQAGLETSERAPEGAEARQEVERQ